MHSGSIWARLVSISSHRQQSKWYMRVIRCVTIVSREVFFSLHLCSLVSLISELKQSLTKQPREISSEKRAEKFHTDDATLPCFASDWLKQICHMARPMGSTTQIRVSALVPQTLFRETKPVMASQKLSWLIFQSHFYSFFSLGWRVRRHG